MTAPMTAVWMPGLSQKFRCFGVAPGSPPPGAWALSGWVSIAMGYSLLSYGCSGSAGL